MERKLRRHTAARAHTLVALRMAWPLVVVPLPCQVQLPVVQRFPLAPPHPLPSGGPHQGAVVVMVQVEEEQVVPVPVLVVVVPAPSTRSFASYTIPKLSSPASFPLSCLLPLSSSTLRSAGGGS